MLFPSRASINSKKREEAVVDGVAAGEIYASKGQIRPELRESLWYALDSIK